MSGSGSQRTGDVSLAKTLTNLDALALGFGAMIGFGWVVLTGDWINEAGTVGAIIAVLVGGAIMAVVGLVYSELTSAMPKAGGIHNYALRALGPRWAFIASWALAGGYVTVVAFEAVAFPRTVAYIIPEISQIPLWDVAGDKVHLSWALLGVVAAIIITWLNVRGVKPASIAQNFTVIFLVAVGVLMIFGSVTRGSAENMEPLFTPGIAGIFAVLIAMPFLFIGFDVIPQTAEEVNVPPRRIGWLVVISVLMATAWYAMVVLTTSSAMNVNDLVHADIAVADAFGTLFNSQILANILIAGGIAGILTSWNSLLMGASRLVYSLSRTGMLPAWFGKLHPKYQTPANALYFIGGLSLLAPFFGEIMLNWLVDSGGPSIIIAYFFVSVIFVALRRKEPTMDRPLNIGRGWKGEVIGWTSIVLTGALFTVYLPGMPSALDWQPWLIFGIWWVIGLVFFVRVPGGIKPGPNAEAELVSLARDRTSR
ncbi:APC family permease [Auritidibacter ignavus]|uniref:APC family permease n=1 Tax=Auritidibacter ignavus TaxID=678932 RepID=A0AAJ6DDA1_9MICC|nr:APC family permease [Auritidibacter ignavus]WGH87395.1 APC family permease [Auritidibacter ignavus]WGH89682.1 APC family permease [Auritidibacter ignavus]WGH94515.1 APC family permease [Auritidibacter ignavus]